MIILLLISIVLVGCVNEKSDVEPTVSDGSPTNNRYPSFVVESTTASKGDKDVVINVSIKDNPGFLTMAMNISYDSDTMSLTKVVSGSNYSEYNFVGPKNKQSGCTAAWFVSELPEDIIDGNILKLHFEIKESAKIGVYPVSVSRSNNGGVVDQNKKEIIFNNAIGYIEIN